MKTVIAIYALDLAIIAALLWPSTTEVITKEETAIVEEVPPVIELPEEPVQVVKETVIVVSKPGQTAVREKELKCGGWQASQVGGSYKKCEWR